MRELKLIEGREAPIYFAESTDSTNTRLKELARQGAPHGAVAAALEQTGGKGRLGRRFTSPPGGLYLSILWRPDCSPEKAARLSRSRREPTNSQMARAVTASSSEPHSGAPWRPAPPLKRAAASPRT